MTCDHEYEFNETQYIDTITVVDRFYCVNCGLEKEEYRDIEPPEIEESSI